jgi:hypothetical protein
MILSYFSSPVSFFFLSSFIPLNIYNKNPRLSSSHYQFIASLFSLSIFSILIRPLYLVLFLAPSSSRFSDMVTAAVGENAEEQQNGKSLFDHVQQPGVSNQMAHQISLLEYEFNMVELQQCMLLPLAPHCPSPLFVPSCIWLRLKTKTTTCCP